MILGWEWWKWLIIILLFFFNFLFGRTVGWISYRNYMEKHKEELEYFRKVKEAVDKMHESNEKGV